MNLENYILNKVSKLERVKSESVKLNLVRKWIEDYNDNLKKEREEENKHCEFYYPFEKTLHSKGFEKRVELWKEKGLKYMLINENFDKDVKYNYLSTRRACFHFAREIEFKTYERFYIYNVSLSPLEFEDMHDFFVKIAKNHLKKLDIKRRKRKTNY